MTEPTDVPQQSASPNDSTSPNLPAPQGPTPTPTPAPAPAPEPAPASAPTPGSVNGDVPVETWRRSIDEINEAPSAQRHELLSNLLDDLDSQVSSL